MRIISNILLWLAVISTGFAVSTERFELVYSGIAPSGKLHTDHTGNVYFVDDHRIIKLETASGNTFEYGSLSAGTISSADVSNPFQILVFYRDFNRIMFLNNKLAPLRGEIDMSDLGIDKAILAASSGQGGFWVFSDRDNRIVYFDQQLQRSHQSMIISSLADSGNQPVYLTESRNRLYLHVPLEGIMVFDRFASYLKTIPYAGPSRFRVVDGQIIYFYKGDLLNLNFEAGKISKIYMPPDVQADYADIQPERMYILSEGRIYSYRVRQ